MSTKVIIPRVEYSLAFMGTDQPPPDTLSRAAAGYAQQALSNTSLASSSMLTNFGLATQDTFEEMDPSDHADRFDLSRTPRVLETVGAILIDDLSEADEIALRETADVYENVDLELVAPVQDDEGTTTGSPELWHLDQAWGDDPNGERGKITGKDVTIGILDTGIDGSHPEFAGKNVFFQEYDARGLPVKSARPGQSRDAGAHGTHVSAIAAGRTVGVAPDADLAVAAVLTQRTERGYSGKLAQILAGYNWLGHSVHDPSGSGRICHIINASLGQSGFHPYLYSSVDVLRSLPRALLIAAIGNSGRRGSDLHGSPGNYDNVLGVGATDAADRVANFSDWGLESTRHAFKPDMSAPGVNIHSALPSGRYGTLSGTSMAAPMVSGAAALMLEKYGMSFATNPNGLHRALTQAVSTATNFDPVNRDSSRPNYSRIGAGRLDLTLI
jgi:subtilisin family serine protease